MSTRRAVVFTTASCCSRLVVSSEIAAIQIHSSPAAVIAVMVALKSSGENTLVQLDIYCSKSPGNLDRQSASILAFPGRYFTVKLKSANSATHRNPVALSLALVSMYVSGLLSV